MNWDNVNDNVNQLSFEGQTILAKIVSVYDGDTIKVVFPLNNTLYKWNCRLLHVDTPELRTRNENEKKFGYFVRDELKKKILNKVLNIKCEKFDKYGRLLIEILEENNITINEWLIQNDYAFRYDGGTKKNWEPYLLEKTKNILNVTTNTGNARGTV